MALVLVRGSMLRVLLSLLAAASPSSGLVLPRSSTTPAIHPPAGPLLHVLSDEPRVVLAPPTEEEPELPASLDRDLEARV